MPMHIDTDSWLPANWPAPSHVIAGTTTRIGGISPPPYQGFNLAMHVGDDPKCVAENRQQLVRWLSLPSEPLWLNQVHGHCVVNSATAKTGTDADASFTNQAGVVCAVLTADCLPVFFTDRQGNFVAVAHAGWRGLAQGIIGQTLQTIPANPADVLVWLGPAIGPTAFEVGPDVYQAFVERHDAYRHTFIYKDAQHWWMNVYAAAREELAQAGVMSVYGGQHCTYLDPQRFYSYRRDGKTGRMANLIWLSG